MPPSDQTSPDQIRVFIHDHLVEVPERSHGDEIAVVCPQPGCGDVSGNRSINIRTGLTSCWRCNVGGPLSRWARNIGLPVDFGDYLAPAVTVDALGDIVESLDTVGDVVKPSGYVPSVELPRGFTRIADEPDCAYSRLIAKMARRKKLEFQDLAEAGVGFTRSHPKWEPFAIFPVFEWGRPVYYQGRTYVDRPGESTKLFPTSRECPLSSRYWLYNIDEVAGVGGVVIAVEAIMNVLSLRKELKRRGIGPVVPLAVFKHKLSLNQREKLLATIRRAKAAGHPVTEVCFMYDGRTKDEIETGSTGDAARTAREDASALSSAVPVSVVNLPDRVDPNDNAECAVDCFLDRRPYNRIQCVVPE